MKHQAICAPEWLRTGSIYQINPRTFSAEGTIQAVTKELPKLKELGFSIMYLFPIFEEDSSENRANWSERQKKYGTENPKNPYRMNNYFTIDPEYGTMDDLREFVDASHALGMRVILDLVYLHIGPDAPILKRHPEFAKQDADGNIQLSVWHFPTLDYTCPGLREYMWSNMVYLVGELDVDGFRCDVGDGVPIDFWNEGRRRIQAIRPDAVLINEGRNWDYLLTGFDASYFFDWHECLYRVFRGETPLEELRRISTPENMPEGGLLLRDIDNHDTVTDWPARTEIIAGHDGMELIEVINYLIDGIPMVYCGNELADEANINMFANRFHMGRYEVTDRSIAGREYSLRRQEVMKRLNALKHECSALQYGTTRWLPCSDDAHTIAFEREFGGQKIILVGSIADAPATVQVEGLPECTKEIMSRGGRAEGSSITLEKYGYVVLSSQ